MVKLLVYYLDDEPILCDLFVEEYESEKISIKTFVDYQKLIEETKKTPPHIIFLDYRLPGITGDQVAIKMNNSIPKYLITGDLQIKTNYSFDGIIQKPYNEDYIRQIMHNFLNK